ncbi:MAG: hypothetical protein JW395_1299 [Nitrospira sp.]|nr:hypothetical protein [Nitrospira sp.]
MTESSPKRRIAASTGPARRHIDPPEQRLATWIKERLRRVCPPGVYASLVRLWSYYLAFRDRQVKRRFGDKNPNLTFYVIRRLPPGAGLFSNVWHVISHVNKVKKDGWIPVVDMERYTTFYNEPVEINGTFNAWEYYFKQPSPYSLNDAYEGANVVVSGLRPIRPDLDLAFCSEFSGDLNGLSEFIRANITLAPGAEERLSKVHCELFGEGRSVLGVFSRGSDYSALRPAGHPRQPESVDLIAKTRELIAAWHPDKVFVTTEEQRVVDAFRSAFPGMVITTDRFFITDYDGQTLVPQIDSKRENGKYLSGLEYLVDIYALSNCHYFLGALTCGSKFALAMNGGRYRDKCILDLGAYE